MAATNLMGRGISQKTIAALLSHIPDLITSDYSNEEKIEMCNEVKGIQDKTCRPFIRNIPKFIKFIKEQIWYICLKYLKIFKKTIWSYERPACYYWFS